ncbi:hypothetical protein INT08_06660 [Prosthecochloris sp. N3]|uniref:DUF4760 domain-containing protein n=1 Tax=Prosthecochloris ethylica TaxID=2743976 RepID=A0ABR9XS26_9CHLB|nr:hypothetical protein [Prosthecochloris ethylica]MBF0585316.1 hypothetical protein [Prosthecochloris ethylica]MBF0636852.1 hypothetical protein [Prosthecochloris ethylica]
MLFSEAISVLAVFVALVALWWEVKQNTQQAKIQNFLAYTQRYQEIMANLPCDIDRDSFSLDSLDLQKKEYVLRWIRAYYDLCSEEYYLYRQRLIDKNVWLLWEMGMKDSFNRRGFVEGWEFVQSNQYYSKSFAEYVGKTKNG